MSTHTLHKIVTLMLNLFQILIADKRKKKKFQALIQL